MILDLEASLRGVPVADAEAAVLAFFDRAPASFLGLGPADLAGAVARAVAATPA
ncbi:MAG: hypothetical protein M0Z28_04360 [Rhodospirillales bacterium]|nr:hypothetical protein [Rhodospirillales bacterium]